MRCRTGELVVKADDMLSDRFQAEPSRIIRRQVQLHMR
jgi:hypothetical protein